MVFSKEWDQRYINNTHLSIWPWSDVVSLVHRHCNPINERTCVLELGCGAGANIPFFLALGVQYYAIEGSPSIVRRLEEKFPQLKGRISVGDFSKELPFDLDFDLVLDRASLTHNDSDSIKSALDLIWNHLKPTGRFIGVHWFSTNHSEFNRGIASGEDVYTRTNFTSGPFAQTGAVHFSDLPHLRNLFTQFELLLLEEQVKRVHVPASDEQFAAWNIVAGKPHE